MVILPSFRIRHEEASSAKKEEARSKKQAVSKNKRRSWETRARTRPEEKPEMDELKNFSERWYEVFPENVVLRVE